jgi:hypothetical protein
MARRCELNTMPCGGTVNYTHASKMYALSPRSLGPKRTAAPALRFAEQV